MANIDLVAMLGNLSQSLLAVDILISALSYITGIVLVYTGVLKLKKITGSGGQSQEHYFMAFALLIAGAVLLFLPTSIKVVSMSTFGSQNILSYANYNKWDLFQSIGVLVKTAGLIWFVRGTMMMVQASQPGEQHGMRGFFFLISGMLALNFTLTMSAVSYILHSLVGLFISYKK
jgi:hypothetical protein